MLLTLIKATPTTKTPGFILKLQTKTSLTTAFGQKDAQLTFYMKTQTCALQQNQSAELDINQFQIIERPHTIQENGVDKVIMLKWLQL